MDSARGVPLRLLFRDHSRTAADGVSAADFLVLAPPYWNSCDQQSKMESGLHAVCGNTKNYVVQINRDTGAITKICKERKATPFALDPHWIIRNNPATADRVCGQWCCGGLSQ